MVYNEWPRAESNQMAKPFGQNGFLPVGAFPSDREEAI